MPANSTQSYVCSSISTYHNSYPLNNVDKSVHDIEYIPIIYVIKLLTIAFVKKLRKY